MRACVCVLAVRHSPSVGWREARPGAEAFPSSLDKPKLSRGVGSCGLGFEGYNFGQQSIRLY